MDQLNLCWKGMAGTGKKTALWKALAEIARLRNLPFHPIEKQLNAPQGGGEDDAESSESGQFMYECSTVHIGFDIARMSMQDKHILRPVLAKLGRGSQVLAGNQGRACRILVFYHAHLLSSESVLLIQACLEQNEGDVSIWMTSELPVPLRIRDWFVEVPTSGEDRNFAAYANTVSGPVAHWNDIFREIFLRWQKKGPPTLDDVKEVKAYVQEMLMRNLRWVEATHFILDTLLTMEGIREDQRKKGVEALAKLEATAGGQTIPSYRIPILWESLFLQLRTILSGDGVTITIPSTPVSAPSSPKKRAPRATKAATPVA